MGGDRYGYHWTQNNSHGTWIQLTTPEFTVDNDVLVYVMTRIHSEFDTLIKHEDCALLVFDSSKIQVIFDESFAHIHPQKFNEGMSADALKIEEQRVMEQFSYLLKSYNN